MMYKTLFGLMVLVLFLSQAVSAVNPAVVGLGSAGGFAILSKSGISTTGTTSIVGDLGVSPIDSTAVTGFGLIADSSNTFSTSSLVTGKIYAADYAPPTPSDMTTAIGDMEIAYTDAAGRTDPTATELGAGDISVMTITPGLYKWGTGVTINTGVTLDCQNNNTDGVFIFQIAQDLTVGNGAIVTLSGGCQAKNIFWQVAGQTTLGTTADFSGIILSKTLIALNTGAKLNGRALAQTAVTLNANAITAPTESRHIPGPTPAPVPTPTTGGSSGSNNMNFNSGGWTTTPVNDTIVAEPIIANKTVANETVSNRTVVNETLSNKTVGNKFAPVVTFAEPATNQSAPLSGFVVGSTEANDNSLTFFVTAIAILLVAGGLYYYFRVMKNRKSLAK